MGLSSDLVSQFSKVVNTKPESSNGTLRGTIVKYGESLYVQLDGSNEITPVARTVELNEGDRVEVSIQNHSATVTGNLTSPSIGVVTEGNLRSEIEQRATYIKLKVQNGDGSFTEYKQDVDAFYFIDPEGTMKIKGGSLYLNGCIKFEDFNAETKENLEQTAETAEQALEEAESASSSASSARSVARSIANGTYVNGTFIDGKTIKSPIIEGNEIRVYGTFQTWGVKGDGVEPTGYMGAATGRDAGNETTYGVVLSNTWNSDTDSVGNSYVIVTNAGVRLQFDDNNIVVSKGGVYINTGEYTDGDGVKHTCKAYYNGTEIGGQDGSITVTPKWG